MARKSRRTMERATRRKRLASRVGAVVTTISLPEDLHQQAAIVAAERGIVLTEVFRQSLAAWLSREARRRA